MLFLMDKFIPKETKNTEEMVRPRSQHPVEEEEKEETEEEEDTVSNANNNDTQETEVPERTTLKKKSDFKSPKKVKRVLPVSSGERGTSSGTATSRGQEAYQILQETIASRKPRDDSTIFGEHVAAKHRKYSVHTQSEVEHLI
ncbi:uncharacterized protein [Leptinotarsa decemlineata]|uniref:uncharacterized protein n=1 Tax=Leptinotarsa decemlineata TaxID=7539 RepID=UPI003D30ACB7